MAASRNDAEIAGATEADPDGTPGTRISRPAASPHIWVSPASAQRDPKRRASTATRTGRVSTGWGETARPQTAKSPFSPDHRAHCGEDARARGRRTSRAGIGVQVGRLGAKETHLWVELMREYAVPPLPVQVGISKAAAVSGAISVATELIPGHRAWRYGL